MPPNPDQFTIADTPYASLFGCAPTTGAEGDQAFATHEQGSRAMTLGVQIPVVSRAYAGRCLDDPSKVVIVITSSWVDSSGKKQQVETRTTECYDPDTAATMLKRLNGGK